MNGFLCLTAITHLFDCQPCFVDSLCYLCMSLLYWYVGPLQPCDQLLGKSYPLSVMVPFVFVTSPYDASALDCIDS